MLLVLVGVLSLTEIFATLGVMGDAVVDTALLVEVDAVVIDEFADVCGPESGGGGLTGSVVALFGGINGGNDTGDSSFLALLEEIDVVADGGLGFLVGPELAFVAEARTWGGTPPSCCGGGGLP